MGYTYIYNGQELVNVVKDDFDVPSLKEPVYQYHDVTKDMFMSFDIAEKEKFVKYIHHCFSNIKISQFVELFKFESIKDKKQLTEIAKKSGMANYRGRANLDSIRDLNYLKKSKILSLSGPAKNNIRKIEKETIIIDTNKSESKECANTLIHYLQLSGDIEENIMHLIDLGIKGNYKITIEAESEEI